MIDVAGTALSAEDRELLRHPLVGGVILFARNYVEPVQVAALCADIHALREPRLVIGVDQEGGRVQRFRAGFTELPALARIGEAYDRDAATGLELAADCAWLMATELRAVGVDFSFAPVLDLRTAHSAVIGDRALHGDPAVVARLGVRYLNTLHRCGMAGVGKHFPGHGCVAADSHHELPVDQRDFADLELTDLVPFRALIGAGLEGIMCAHVLYPAVDHRAAGYSPLWVKQILRRELGFGGLVFSDDLSMVGADNGGSYASRAEDALAAGCDVLLVCNQRAAAIAVIDALGRRVFPESQVRLMRMQARGAATGWDALAGDAGWRSRAARVRNLTAAPELALGDDNLLA